MVNHPGRSIKTFVKKLNRQLASIGEPRITLKDVSLALEIHTVSMSRLVKGQQRVTPEIACILEHTIGMDSEELVKQQALFDLQQAKKELAEKLRKTKKLIIYAD